MKTKDFLKKLETILEQDDFEALDLLLLEINSSEMALEQQEILSDIIDEATLYLEFKELDYKATALDLILKLKK